LGDDVPLSALTGLLIALLLLSAFFSGSETALVSLNRYQLRHKARQGHRGARLAERLLQRPDRLIGLILLGNNLVNFSAASLVAIIALKIGGQPAVALGTLILTLVVLIFSEAAPKTLAALHPERIAFPAAFVYYPLLKITYPIVWLTNAASNGVLFLFGVRSGDVSLTALTREELRTIVHEAGGRISNRYQQMLLSILDLEKVTVRSSVSTWTMTRLKSSASSTKVNIRGYPSTTTTSTRSSESCTCAALPIWRSDHLIRTPSRACWQSPTLYRKARRSAPNWCSFSAAGNALR
jgi:Mg2+/Co2+ transporter CorB